MEEEFAPTLQNLVE
jgi:arsenite-transporting ATPase